MSDVFSSPLYLQQEDPGALPKPPKPQGPRAPTLADTLAKVNRAIQRIKDLGVPTK